MDQVRFELGYRDWLLCLISNTFLHSWPRSTNRWFPPFQPHFSIKNIILFPLPPQTFLNHPHIFCLSYMSLLVHQLLFIILIHFDNKLHWAGKGGGAGWADSKSEQPESVVPLTCLGPGTRYSASLSFHFLSSKSDKITLCRVGNNHQMHMKGL